MCTENSVRIDLVTEWPNVGNDGRHPIHERRSLVLEPAVSLVFLTAITIIRPETLVRWHRAGFRRYWRWRSRSLGGRPQIDADLRALIRQMSADNP